MSVPLHRLVKGSAGWKDAIRHCSDFPAFHTVPESMKRRILLTATRSGLVLLFKQPLPLNISS
jgi:hypothetical protein